MACTPTPWISQKKKNPYFHCDPLLADHVDSPKNDCMTSSKLRNSVEPLLKCTVYLRQLLMTQQKNCFILKLFIMHQHAMRHRIW